MPVKKSLKCLYFRKFNNFVTVFPSKIRQRQNFETDDDCSVVKVKLKSSLCLTKYHTTTKTQQFFSDGTCT